MHITRITTQNLKGRSGSWDLTPCNLVIGDPFSGKSAIAIAVRLAMTGSAPPPIGKAGPEIYRSLAGDPDAPGTMSVRATLSNGHETGMEFTRDAKGSVATKGGPPPALTLPDMLLDPRSFFGLTEQERIRRLFAACHDVRLDDESLKGKLRAIEAKPAAKADLLISDLCRKVDQRVAAGGHPSDILSGLVDEWKQALKESKAEMKRLESGLSVLNRAAGSVAGKPPTDEELSKARARVREITDNSAKLSYQLESLLAVRRGIAETKQKVADLKAAVEAKAALKPWVASPVDQQMKDIAAARTTTMAEIDTKARALEVLERQMKVLAKGSCPTCGCDDKAVLAGIKERVEKEGAKAAKEIIKLRKKLSVLVEDAQSLAEKAARYESALESYQETVRAGEAAEAAMAHLPAIPEPPSEEEIANIQKQIGGLRADYQQAQQDLAGMQERNGAWDAAQDLRKQRDEREAAALGASCAATVYASALKCVSDYQEELIGAVISRTLETANKFTAGLLRSPLQYHNGEIGRRVGGDEEGQVAGGWVSWKAFSGTEELIALAGFAVAVTVGAPIRLVVMDELGRMPAKMRRRLVHRMRELCADGVIDQFIGIDSNVQDWGDGWGEGAQATGVNLIAL